MRDWPTARRFDRAETESLCLPVGGIGTGTIGFSGRGRLQDFEIGSVPAKGFAPDPTLVLVRITREDGQPVTLLAEGPLSGRLDGPFGAVDPYPALPRFRSCETAACYPRMEVTLRHPQVPGDVVLSAWNPFVPPDADDSSLPVLVLDVEVRPHGSQQLTADLAIAIGSPYPHLGPASAEPSPGGTQLRVADATFAVSTTQPGMHALLFVPRDPEWPSDGLRQLFEHFAETGTPPPAGPPAASLPVAGLWGRLPSQGSGRLLLTWRHPSRQGWGSAGEVGNSYAGRHTDAADVARDVAVRLPDLEVRTQRFSRAVLASTPRLIAEAALSTLPALRSQTMFRAGDGRLYGYEGCGDSEALCPGSCTHVYAFEQAIPPLFGSLARGMRDLELGHGVDPTGRMSFRLTMPPQPASDWPLAAADGQLAALVRAWQHYRLSGDLPWLAESWPLVKRAMCFAWLPGSWDGDVDGLPTGVQHTTMDVDYVGVVPSVAGWYLAALTAVGRMAEAVGDTEFATRCADLARAGRRLLQSRHDGGFFVGSTQPLVPGSPLPDHIARFGREALEQPDPPFQLGAACAVDQVVGDWGARLAGLGPVLDPELVTAALQTVVDNNHVPDLADAAHGLRSFGTAGDAGTVMATWPRGGRPARPFPYYGEVMTGFEHALAGHLLLLGRCASAAQVLRAVRARHDGRRRNPFDEAEHGHHYARSLASWGTVWAWSGAVWDGTAGALRLPEKPRGDVVLWAAGSAWGTAYEQSGDLVVELGSGSIAVDQVWLGSRAVWTGAEPWSGTDVLRLALDVAWAPLRHPCRCFHRGP